MPPLPDFSLETRLIMALFACYRLAQFIPLDDGPMFVFERAREWPLRFQPARWSKSLADFLECPYCQGVWFAAVLAYWVVSPRNVFFDWSVLILALAGGQAFLQGVGDRRNDSE